MARRISSLVGLLLTALVACASPTDDVDGSEADLIATFDQHSLNGAIDITKASRMIIVGDSDELGRLPLLAGTTRARRYAQLYPDQQIVVFITKSVSQADAAHVGLHLVTSEPTGNVRISDLSRLSTTNLLAAIARFKRIASIDFFGHSSPFGALLESDGDDRKITSDAPGVTAIASRFARDLAPYVTLNGCNGGVYLAPELSRVWEVPVSGALSATHFETTMSDGHWYPDDANFHPPNVKATAQNTLSFGAGTTPSCANGGCSRMKPENNPYFNVWANPNTGFQFGLNYYKFFCDFPDTTNACARGMAASLYAFPSVRAIDHSSSDADVREVLADFFCDTNKDPSWFETCRTGLFGSVESGLSFSPMKSANDYSLECSFKTCEMPQHVLRCSVVEGVPQQKSCAWVSSTCPAKARPDACKTKVENKQTTRTEFLRYMEGHRLLRGF